jgi:hypothetical protein
MTMTAFEKSKPGNIEAITHKICARINPLTPKIRTGVEKVVVLSYEPMIFARLKHGPITERWHDRMVAIMVDEVSKCFNAVYGTRRP